MDAVKLDSKQYSITVCICTRNRPTELVNAISSVIGTTGVTQVVVSDDSTDDCTRNMVTRDFPQVSYTQGPRRGLAANRNNALKIVAGTHVLFIDDDVVLSDVFVENAMQHLLDCERHPSQLIITGPECNNGVKVWPQRQSYLGYQSRPYGTDDPICSVVINSTMFPRTVFDFVKFDENLIYGYEEVDFAARATLRCGFYIALVPKAMNFHYPSTINREYYSPFIEASRIYVTFKKYWWLQKRRGKASMFLIISAVHLLAHEMKVHGLKGIILFTSVMAKALYYIFSCFAAPRNFV